MSQNLQIFVKFQRFQFENLVDFEKCCKTHIFLQKSEPIQPKTSTILPKFCQPTLSDVSAVRPQLDAAIAIGAREVSTLDAWLDGVRRFVAEGARTARCSTQLSRDPTNFRGLVLGCIEAKFCK